MTQPLNNALDTLNRTITGINNKISTQVERGLQYKTTLISSLNELTQKIMSIKGDFDSIPSLKNELTVLKKQLADSTNNLGILQNKLTETTELNNQLNTKIQELNTQLVECNKQIEKINIANVDKTANIDKLTSEKTVLETEKKEVQSALDASNLQIRELVEQINSINESLTTYISKIDSIAESFGDLNNGEIKTKFDELNNAIQGIKSLVDNGSVAASTNTLGGQPLFDAKLGKFPYYAIYRTMNDAQKSEIIDLLNGPSKSTIQNTNIYDEATAASIINSIFSARNNTNARNRLVQLYDETKKGGKRRHKKTIKKRYKNYKKTRGGYTYKSNKKLDKSSSIISTSTIVNSNTKSKTSNNKYKTIIH